MKQIGLIDVDGHNFPSIPLMKISAWHKKHGDAVEWYEPLFSDPKDIVYMSKVFSFTPDYEYHINAKKIIKGGTGYGIKTANKKEIYTKVEDGELPPEMEHIYPDYGLYPELCKDKAFGFLTRGCPRGCEFCHVGCKEGRQSYKVADLPEFWKGQKNIVLCDPILIACPDWRGLLEQLIDSGAKININQGLDIRMMTQEKAEMIKRLRVDTVHFAWDRYEDKELIIPKFKEFKRITEWGARKTSVFVLTNYNTTLDQDLERIYTLRNLDYDPFVMIYNKESTKPGDEIRKLQRWVNNKIVFKTVKRFQDYDANR